MKFGKLTLWAVASFATMCVAGGAVMASAQTFTPSTANKTTLAVSHHSVAYSTASFSPQGYTAFRLNRHD